MTSVFRLFAATVAIACASAAGGADTPPEPSQASEPFPGAPIALLVDISSGQTLFQREPDRRFMPASITKVMTVYLAFELIDEGKLSQRQTFRMSQKAYDEWHGKGSRMFLDREDPVSVQELLLGITSVSANDGAIVLAEGAAGSVDKWVAMMNAEARKLGMTNTHFGRPNGWMDDGRTFTTARDLATLAEAIFTRHPDKYRFYFGRPGLEYHRIVQANHDPITGHVKGADGIKSGFTNQAGYGFLGSAVRNGRRLVMVVADSPSGSARKQAARDLMEWGFAAFSTQRLFGKGAVVGEADVQGGDRRSIPLLAAGEIAATTPRGRGGRPKLTIRYEGPLAAPIRKGETVAQLEIAVSGAPPSRVPLVAGADVEGANGWERLINGLAGIIG